MEETLKVTSILSDPTRFHIYEYISNQRKDVTVQEIADLFHIHPNVARLHLSKLEEINLIISETKKTGKGGRPSRFYRLSDDVIQLSFPYRDYQLLSNIAVHAIGMLDEQGQKLFNDSAYEYGITYLKKHYSHLYTDINSLSDEEKLNIIKDASASTGLFPMISIKEDGKTVIFEIRNCPFKESAFIHHEAVCNMHNAFLKGMFSVLFPSLLFEVHDNMALGCETCTYYVSVTT
ncbi:helix-turn-helix transcriptional regulator [Bacillus songklensis]|uniref:Helix-turn-helix transcriptional regulator n=1 Tax=Bacillus songklensis TaxID=1069116 RepID=A0ABV8AZ19_9BACI